MLQLPVAAVF